MKKLITIALLAPLAAFGQKWEIGINGGISSTGAAKINATDIMGTRATINPTCAVSLKRNFGHIQIGLQIEPTQMSYEYKTWDYYRSSTMSYHKVTLGNPNVPILLTGNYKVNLRKSYIYGGVCIGYGIYTTTFPKSNHGDVYDLYLRPKNSPMAGAQVGYDYFITKRFAINAEAAYRVALRSNRDVWEYYPNTIYYYSFTLGVHFIL